MEQKKLFPTTPLGFDKKAVISYIEQLNQAYETELAKKDALIRELQERGE